jgi:hypothetical protein
MASAAARLLRTYAIQVSFLLRADEVIRGLPRGQAGIAVCPSAEAPASPGKLSGRRSSDPRIRRCVRWHPSQYRDTQQA